MNVIKIGDITQITSGYAFQSKYFNEEGRGIPLIRIRDIDKDESKTYYEGDYSEEHIVKKDDFLISMDGEFKIAQWNGKTALLNQRVCRIQANEQFIDSKYMYYFLPIELKKLEDATPFVTVKHLSIKQIKDIEVPLPSIEQQKKIAAVLDRAQALIKKRKTVIAKLDELIQAIFIDLFGDPIKNPQNYEVVQLEELISFLTSGSRGWAKYFSKEGEIFITIKNVKDGQLQLGDITYVNAPVGKESERTKVKEGDLLISITADLGRTAVISKDVASRGAYINQHLSLIRLNQKCNPRYLSSYLESVGGKQQFESLNQTGVKSGLNFAAIKSLKIVLPPLEKQNRYDVLYRKYLLEKENMITSLAMLEKNFSALLQWLFKGGIEIDVEVTA